MKNIALEKRATKPNKQPSEIVDIEHGNDLGRIVPSEFLLLDTPIFAKQFSEKTLMQRRLEDKEKEGKGPIVVCEDMSGSMSGANDIWAKAYFLGFQVIAAKEKRDIHFISFDTKVHQTEFFPAGKVEPLELCSMLSFFSGGGTNFDKPLQKALEIIETTQKKADIIMISDGVSSINTSIKAKIKHQKSKGMSLYLVLIGAKNPGPFAGIADRVISIIPGQDNKALEIFAEI
jgi:uncharacterized protein with von Willebrand factor type A (vWA) domain